MSTCVVVRLQTLVCFEPGIKIRVHGIDECKVNTLSLSVVVDPSKF